MRFNIHTTLVTSLALISSSLAALPAPYLDPIGTFVGPLDIGPYKNIILTISASNTLNSTANLVGPDGNFLNGLINNIKAPRAPPATRTRSAEKRGNPKVVLSFNPTCQYNSYINAYVSATDPNTGAFVMLNPNGEWYYPPVSQGSGNVAIDPNFITLRVPTHKTTNFTLPGYANSARIWYAINGTLPFFTNGASGKAQMVQPSAANQQDASYNTLWGFTEFDNSDAGGMYVNPTAVDFIGVPVLIGLKGTDGKNVEAVGLMPSAIPGTCGSLQQQGQRDGWPWGNLCRYTNAGKLVRVVSPNLLISGGFNTGGFNNSNAFNGYFEPYVDQVYQKYSTQDLTIDDTQINNTNTTCRVSNNQLVCNNGDESPYAKPSSRDILSCNSGSLLNAGSVIHKANTARLGAAFNRGTLLLNGGNVQPSLPASSYYTIDPTNYYSKYVHANSWRPMYAFPYDDVHANGQPDQSSTLTTPNPALLTLYLGGFWVGQC